STEVRPFLATTALIEAVFPRIHPGQPMILMGTMTATQNLFTRYSPGRPVTVPTMGPPPPPSNFFARYSPGRPVTPGGWVGWPAFERIGHSLFAFLFSLAGGGVSRYLAARPARDGRSDIGPDQSDEPVTPG